MKLLVCDVEGTIFQPYKIKDAQHASYIWTAIAAELRKEREEVNTQKKWEDGEYGLKQDGQAYIKWVKESINIHVRYGLDKKTFNKIIDAAPYVDGVKTFFTRLARSQYIPLLISGGIQNLNEKACRDLNINLDDAYAACKYYFGADDKIDQELTFLNTSNFYGKHEIVKIALRKYGLRDKDWVFIGDGINDVSVAKFAPISIGISPVDELKDVATYSYESFAHMMNDNKCMTELGFFEEKITVQLFHKQSGSELETARTKVNKQVGKLNLEAAEKSALNRLVVIGCFKSWEKRKIAGKITGIKKLLEQGELSFALTSKAIKPDLIVSALLQPFSNAVEIMIYVCLALKDDSSDLGKILNDDLTLRFHKNRIKNPDLKMVIDEYLDIRNITAHSYKEISIDAAQTFILRTYEIIQRLENILDSQAIHNEAPTNTSYHNLAENIGRHFRAPDSTPASSNPVIRRSSGKGKKRVHELAKELSLTSAELIQKIVEWKLLPGVKLVSSSPLEDYLTENIVRRLRSPDSSPTSSVPGDPAS